MRDAEISEPTTSFVGLVNGGTLPGVCVRMSAKNSFGAYIGIQTISVPFRNGVAAGTTQPIFGTCANVQWKPFPEMNGNG